MDLTKIAVTVTSQQYDQLLKTLYQLNRFKCVFITRPKFRDLSTVWHLQHRNLHSSRAKDSKLGYRVLYFDQFMTEVLNEKSIGKTGSE